MLGRLSFDVWQCSPSSTVARCGVGVLLLRSVCSSVSSLVYGAPTFGGERVQSCARGLRVS